MRIGDVAKRAGIPASTLRYYEAIGLLPAPPRTGGQRQYDDSIFEVLDLIQVAKNAGFSLDDIRQLLHEREGDTSLSAAWRRMAERKLTEVEQTIQHYQALQHRLEQSLTCRCTALQDCQLLA